MSCPMSTGGFFLKILPRNSQIYLTQMIKMNKFYYLECGQAGSNKHFDPTENELLLFCAGF